MARFPEKNSVYSLSFFRLFAGLRRYVRGRKIGGKVHAHAQKSDH